MLPPVILMQRLDSSLDPTLVACERPWFLGIPRDLSEKSWFYSTFLSPGVPYRAPLIGGGATGGGARPWGPRCRAASAHVS